MRIRGWWLFVGVVGCGGGTVTVPMTQINNSGENGTAVLKDVGGGRTEVTITLTPGTDTGMQAVHIHNTSDGTCPGLLDIFQGLNPLIDGGSDTTINVKLSDLQGKKYVINAHNSVTFTTYVSCGPIP